MPLAFGDELSQYIITAVQTLAGQVRALNQGETPFVDGVLSPSGGGTGVANSNSFTLTITADTTLSGTPALLSHTHPAADVVSGTMATARLGAGSATATTLLHGDSTWSAVDIVTETSGTLSIARGGTGATTAGAALTALGAASDTHVHPAADITSGTMATARLGSGTANANTLLHGDSTWSAVDITAETTGTLSIARGGTGATTAAAALAALGGVDATHNHAGADITSGTVAAARLGATPTAAKLLFGDNTWAALVAADIPSLAASIITSGTHATARLGSGTANSTTFLRGDSTWAAPSSGVDGSGANTRIAYWTDTNTLSSTANMVWTGSQLSVSGMTSATTYEVDGTQVVSNRHSGWTAWTGAVDRGAHAPSTVTLVELASAFHALLDDLTSHGLIG